jgi:hypothetical protein
MQRPGFNLHYEKKQKSTMNSYEKKELYLEKSRTFFSRPRGNIVVGMIARNLKFGG